MTIRLEASNPIASVLFAAGAGGNPERHAPLLRHLHGNGINVIAPVFERFASPSPSPDVLLGRAATLNAALQELAAYGLPVTGIGHSIGATLLLAIAGGQLYTGPGNALPIAVDQQLKKLVLFAPPTGYFNAPGALVQVTGEIQAWGGRRDVITPAAQLDLLAGANVRIVEDGGHFSFMNELPPGITDTITDRPKFLDELAQEVTAFVLR
ncbi:hypothetical protein MKQ68_11770 [Chitinophaga horti]|uniref:Alpha/beta hydrolase n=1 Tax=Chitinophaga horti TaxID=2920382 RepID=A0ABY6J7V8_9BACT|nr:hypothetical protein [Chitinophaga horti]UYQ95780.1 hypothetical protein MKQ68_11770 [Chitinophaga horti]